MNRLMTIGSLAVAGIFTAGLLATQAPTAFAHDGSDRGDDTSAVVRTVDDRGRDHAEDGRHHHRHGHDDNGRHRGHHHRHGHDDRGRHGGDDRRR